MTNIIKIIIKKTTYKCVQETTHEQYNNHPNNIGYVQMYNSDDTRKI
jgi:hypothetical protein